MACSTKTLKIFALISDVVFAIFGFLVLGIGIYILLKFDHFHTAAFITLGLGIVIVLTAAFGALGAIRESNRLSKTYVGVLIILMVVQIVVIGFCVFFETTLEINVDKTFDQLWRQQPVPIKPGNSSGIASIERWLECCGNSGPSDYHLPPYSCYSHNDKLNLNGCRQKFLDYFAERWTAFNFIGLILVLVELICAGFAYVLANSIVNRWRRSKYYGK